jgi:predicted transcriptional regulator
VKKVPFIKTIWKRALLEIYFHAPNSWTEDSNCNRNTGNSPLQKRLEILNNQQFAEGISFLEEQKLIYTKREPKYSYWVLTEKGFNVALELQKQVREIKGEKRNEKSQLFTIFLTLILACTSMLNFAMSVYPESKYLSFWSFFILIFISIIFIVIEFRKR